MKLTRRQFLGTSLATVAIAACGGGDDGGGGGSGSDIDAASAVKSCTDNGTTAAISSNHGHVLTVTKEDVVAAVDKTYDITGAATHSHTVTLTAANFASLQSDPNGQVMVTSSVTGHTHQVTIRCA